MKVICTLLFICFFSRLHAETGSFVYQQGNAIFSWNYYEDKASVSFLPKNSVGWHGSLLPAFWLQINDKKEYVKASVTAVDSSSGNQITLQLKLGAYGSGHLTVNKETWGIRISEFSVEWFDQIPAIIEMYFGTSLPASGGANIPPTWDRPFMPDWRAEGYCIPGAKSGTVQSYFRNWDFGNASIALGSFGPSLGTPYGAAFPRPLLFAAMGSNDGWINFGAGSIPDAPMLLKIQSTRGCLQYLYREDLWGPAKEKSRVWTDPLRISFDVVAWNAFKKYYSSFPVSPKARSLEPVSFWNTWGMWRHRKYPIKPISDFARKAGSEMLVMDDSWEVSQGAGQYSPQRFPEFHHDIEYIKNNKMDVGFWETLAWISDTAALGLGKQDLIQDANGNPLKSNWNFDPSGESYYCIDISSAHAREFLKERTRKLINEYKPRLIKLDFGYALPDPNMGVPKNPEYRGERYCNELIKLISSEAKSVDPNIIVMYYGISPLWLPYLDIISLDDQGDFGYAVRNGHQEWSMWASLISDRNVMVCGSSTYNWRDDVEVLLNSIVLGVPGSSLPIVQDDGKTIPEQYINRRLAVNSWFRRTILWEPNWFNSYRGGLGRPPELKCWGREEMLAGKKMLTSLVLREDKEHENVNPTGINGLQWSGNWSIVSQDDLDITASKKLAIIPFSAGKLLFPLAHKPARLMRRNMHGDFLFTNWSWQKGILTLAVNEALFEKTAGFLVYEN